MARPEPAASSIGSWRQVVAALWAKSPEREGGEGQSLLDHTDHVLDILGQLARRHSCVRWSVGPVEAGRCAYLAGLIHDLGKASSDFQDVVHGRRRTWGHRHEVLSLAFVELLVAPESPMYPYVVAAVASHHRDAPEIVEERYDPYLDDEDLDLPGLCDSLTLEVVGALIAWMQDATRSFAERAPRVSDLSLPDVGGPLVKGGVDARAFLVDAPRRIRKALMAYGECYRRTTKPGGDACRLAIALRGLVIRADHLASAGVGQLGRIEPGLLEPQPLALSVAMAADNAPPGTSPQAVRWREHQILASQALGSMLMCAPTGSGKTEGALLWCGAQRRSGDRNGPLVYVLPYQASMNAMKRRLEELLRVEVGLLHGRAVQVAYTGFLNQGYSATAAAQAARRAVDLARLARPIITVATPYQLLRGFYRLPGHEAVIAGLTGSDLIVDEVHAYEPKRLGLIIGLLSELVHNWDVRVCCVSATMPSWLKSILSSELGASEIDVSESLSGRFVRHRIRMVNHPVDSDECLARILCWLADNMSVLLAVNTVAQARRLHQRVRDAVGHRIPVLLIHGRFAARDRVTRELEIIKLMKAHVPCVVVATQVIEVSLNLDFDRVITEAAPLEALLQRFGRVNRRGKKGVVPVSVAPAGDTPFYSKDLVDATLRLLGREDGRVVDEARTSSWLDEVYSSSVGALYAACVSRQLAEFRASCVAALRPFAADASLEAGFEKLFDGVEVLPEGLAGEYRAAQSRSAVEASGLLVSVPWRTVARDARFAWDKSLEVRVAHIPYSAWEGLMI